MFIGTMFQSLSLHEDRAELHFNHVACCPYLSPHDLFKDRVSINGYHMLHPSLELTHAHQWGVAQVFGEENWERHVSWRRHIPDFVVWWAYELHVCSALMPIRTCYVWRQVQTLTRLVFLPLSLQVLAWYWPPVLFVATIGVGVGLYHHFGELAGAPCVTCGDYSVPFTLTAFALSLLLVFRTNSSYDRHAVLAAHKYRNDNFPAAGAAYMSEGDFQGQGCQRS